MKDKITKEKFDKYLFITKEAYRQAKSNINECKKELANEFLVMVFDYVQDAQHFYGKGNAVNAFAAINYAHGWLDAGARSKIFLVKDSKLFAVDDE